MSSIDFALYRYTPSIAAASIFAAVFLVITIFHCIRLWRCRAYFFIPFIIGLLCENSPISSGKEFKFTRKTNNATVECAGYIARIFSHFNTTALGPYIVQTMLILVAPPLFAASIYMTLGRVMVSSTLNNSPSYPSDSSRKHLWLET